MDQQQISDLAQQLASQFAAMRPQRNQQASTATTNPAVNSGQPKTPSEADIAQLANRLGSLLHQEAGISSSVATQEAAADPFASVSDPSIYEKEFVDKFLRVNTAVLAYEDRQLLDQAYEQIPVDKFYEDIEVMAKEHPDDSTDDIVIRRLLHWFKNDYFVWVNEPPCVSCQGKTVFAGGIAPTDQERQDGAGFVETYRCTQSSEEVVDVTRRYTVEYDEVVVQRRRSIREPVLARFLHRLSESNLGRLGLDQTEIQAIKQRQVLEMDELLGKTGDNRSIETKDRESGSDEWARARGERR
ncbi:hypothetical protein BC939DRAFT_507875 [Gamsiella multidivaricata]|uniref:uncharacterized protein n=1 Tax=Gamsiella multidivaricata TaxID=101098 RepID=UPI00221F4B60|nr:uncharacterized protein BC939DRAFT_507875 [Gamsiella multidivaricata]KAI7816908.1 hypothetical protein BC939DRAFT_507875 [Gamsiella multidivaricata]